MEETAAGLAQTNVKDALTFENYQKFSKWLISKQKKTHIAGRMSLALLWNLMCRGHNLNGLKLSALGRTADSLVIVFGRMKNDQLGERQYPRNCYCNEKHPWICLFHAIGTHLSVN